MVIARIRWSQFYSILNVSSPPCDDKHLLIISWCGVAEAWLLANWPFCFSGSVCKNILGQLFWNKTIITNCCSSSVINWLPVWHGIVADSSKKNVLTISNHSLPKYFAHKLSPFMKLSISWFAIHGRLPNLFKTTRIVLKYKYMKFASSRLNEEQMVC